jgi:hypothetical protein
MVLVCAIALPAFAQPDRKDKPAKTTKTDTPAKPETKKPVKEQNFNFDGLGLNGRSRSPQLLYFLERANEELERASLEKRSFIPHIVKTVEEEAL